MIEIKDLSLKYPKTRHNPEVLALKNVSFSLEEGTFLVVVGPSGSGKTSLLRAITGIYPSHGKILINNKDISKIHPSDRNISYVSQEYALYPHLTIFDNIAFPLKAKRAPKEEIIKEVYEVSEALGISHLMNRKPSELSGGQQQRVALARALVKKPSLYLFDEPLSNISVDSREEARNLIKDEIKKRKATSIYVTHDMKEAIQLGDKILVISDGEIKAYGEPNELLSLGIINSFDR
ncbi:MAG: ABC transporter ATP-binding protein [Bacilli bacterium]|nr:ABC transporter ATP-binding protein [Bacilli bacterium]